MPGSWILPPALREETGVIFASAFPGMASLVDEVTKEARSRFGAGSKKRLIEFYTGIVQRLKDDREKESITKWFTQEFEGLSGESSDDIYTFNRNFLLRVMSMGHSQLAQLIKAQGPNTHVDAACAGTTQAVLLAKDWIRTGRAKRVLVVAADDVAGRLLFPWIGSGFLAMGAATTNAKVDEAALPFDDRRHGLILGSAAVALVVESEGLVKQRGMDPIASIEAGIVANSGFHGTRLDVDHISTVMEKMISRWEKQSGLSRHELARKMFFMSHETYSPKRGGSSSAEIKALRSTFGESARTIPIANTKGYTGHTMGVGVEDVVALRCLQKQILPPIPNLRVPDPEFQDMNLSSGGSCEAEYALRLAAGFGSQIVMSLYKIISHEENRVVDFTANRAWLKEISGFNDPVISIEDRTLKVRERQIVETASTSKAQSNPLVGASTEKNISVPTAVKDSDTTRQIILALLSEKTGYPSEMLDTNLDLEADLGIDTVKQAEFITEVRENFGIPRIEGLKIADFPTIEHIINFVLEQTSGETSGMETVDSDSTPTGNQLHIERVAEIGAKILELLSAKTGYPPEMLDPDLDLEADLGIDTVKQAEFITEVRETFGIPRIEGLKIADFPTVKHIIGFVMEKKSKDTSKPVPEHSEGSASGSTVSTDSVGASIYEAKLVPAKVEQRASVPEIDELLIIGGDDSFLTSIRKKFEPVPTTWLVDIAALDKRRNKRTGIVNLAFDISSDSELDNSFELFRKLAQTYDNGPVFLVNVVSEDGAWGFEAPKPTGYLSGAVTGAAKSFSREYPDTVCKCLDIHPDILMEHCADLVFGSLVEDFPLETGINRGLEKRVIRFHSGTQTSDKSSSLKQGEVILVSGGARGITAECLKAMATQNSVTFAILARTTFSNHSESKANYSDAEWNTEKFKIIERYKREGKAATPVLIDSELSKLRNEVEVYNNFKQLRSMGCEVIYRSVDISDPDQVDRTIIEIGQLCGHIDVFVHGAGIDMSRSLRSKTIDQIRRVFNVKLKGAKNILDSLSKHDFLPRRIIGFGSVAGRFGNIAQIDYSAANDALAHLFRYLNLENSDVEASVIDWAPWSKIGMATRGSVQQTLEQAGIDFIDPENGVAAFMKELGRFEGSPEVLVAGKLGPFEKDAFETLESETGKTFLLSGQIATIESLTPGEHLRLSVKLDPSHPMLDDHRIDRAAILPGVGGIDLMRQATEILAPEARDLVIQDVHFPKALKIFKSDKFTAEIDVWRVSDPGLKFKAEISSRLLDKEGKPFGEKRIHHEMSFSTARPGNLDLPSDPKWNQTVFVAENDIYSVFFHGAAFRFLDYVSVEREGKGVRFRFRDTKNRPDMFKDLVPAAIEAAFQAGAAFGLESCGVMPLPISIERVAILKNNPIPVYGYVFPIELETKPEGEGRTKIKFDAILKESDGTPAIFVAGFEMIELARFGGFPNRIFEEISATNDLAENLNQDPELLKLFEPEDIEFTMANATEKRRREWISGRILLKRALARLVSSNGFRQKENRTIKIVTDSLGKPRAHFSDDSDSDFATLTLSHSNGLTMASAAASKSFWGIGVDIEMVEERSLSWASDYFSASEIELANFSGDFHRTLTQIWSLKEACLKALGIGLRCDLRDITVVSMDSAGRASLEFKNQPDEILREKRINLIDTRVEDMGDLVLSRVILRS
ncbi:MAG: SDR family NAD(P)-dependent oxidoreductase [Desulfomonilaceae bacterium]